VYGVSGAAGRATSGSGLVKVIENSFARLSDPDE
jgi:hypothetical protein